jgi:hypothetical protein
MDGSNEVTFDTDIRNLVDKYTNEGLLSAGEIIAVLECVKHAVIHAAEDAAAEH